MTTGRYNSKGSPSRRNARRRISNGTVAFYMGFFILILAILVGLCIGMVALNNYLKNFERAQPTAKSQEVFQQLFSNPNWADLYAKAGEKGTIYEGADAYAAHMQKVVGDQKLSYLETSAGLSGGKKYIVRLDNKQKVAEFTLQNVAGEESKTPQWEFDKLSLFYSCNEDAFIAVQPGHTAYVNGVALDDSMVVAKSTTVAEDYLPNGIHGHQEQVLYISGLMAQPNVTVKDPSGNPVEVTYNAETNTYTENASREAISDEFRNYIITASKVYGKYMIGAANKANLREYFDADASAYKTIVGIDTWMQDYKDYRFGDPTISGYYRYSDNLYSVRVSMILYVTRKEGTVKEYSLDSTYFVEKKASGKWLITNMTNKDVQELKSQVKLTYIVNNEIVHSEFVDANASKLTLPNITVPEGQVFSGWFQKTTDDSGKTVMSLVFGPQKDNIVHLGDGKTLIPLVLYARFERESA